MSKKMNSKPMQEILANLDEFPEITLVKFDEEMILNQPIEKWPQVQVFLCFYSSGFPMEKSLEYVNTYKPHQINDLESQMILWDRRKIYQIL